MKTMRRLRFDILRRLLLTALCALLFVYCTPTVPAFAAIPSSTAGGSTATSSNTATCLTIGSPLEELSTYFYLRAEANDFNLATVEMLFQVQGDYADLTKEFKFQLTIPEGMSKINACVDDTPVTLSAENNTVALSHGQRLKLMNVPDSKSYELMQTDALVAQSSDADSGCYKVQVDTTNMVKATLKDNDARVLTLSELKGTETSPAKVTITNTLQNNKAPITGIDNDDSPWLAVVFASAAALAVLCALWLLRKHRHKTFPC